MGFLCNEIRRFYRSFRGVYAYLEDGGTNSSEDFVHFYQSHGVTFKKNAEFLVYSLNLDAQSEQQIKYDPYRGLKDDSMAGYVLLLISGLTRRTTVSLFVCFVDWYSGSTEAEM
jgi:hypothetical protein